MAAELTCEECGGHDLEKVDDEEDTASTKLVMCLDCGHEQPEASGGGDGADSDDRYHNYVVCRIVDVDTPPKKTGKKKMAVVELELGDGRENIRVVTNAKVDVGRRTVVALPGAMVDDGSGELVEVKKTAVAGVSGRALAPLFDAWRPRPRILTPRATQTSSEGMLCDAPMLGWVGGAKGAAVKIPEEFPLGGPPPKSKPRGDDGRK